MAIIAELTMVENPSQWAWDIAGKMSLEMGKYFVALTGVMAIVLIFKAFQKG